MLYKYKEMRALGWEKGKFDSWTYSTELKTKKNPSRSKEADASARLYSMNNILRQRCGQHIGCTESRWMTI